MTTIQVTVPENVAELYYSATEQDKLKLQNMIRLFMHDMFISDTHQTLRELIHDASLEAQKNGLTPEILEEILADEE